MAASIGSLGQFGIDDSGAATLRLDYQSETLVVDEEFRDTNGIRGTLSHDISRVRRNLRRVGGPVSLQPNSLELTYLLQWILGGATSGSGTVTYPLADTLITKDVTIDRVAKVFTYTGCAIDSATFRSSQGEPLSVELQIIGQDESIGNAGTFPSLSIDTTTGPFIFSDLSLSVNSTTVQAKGFELTVNNMIDKERFFNSLTLTATNKLDRMVTMRTTVPYGDAAALYNTGPAGVAVTATFTNGSAVLTFTMGKVTFPRKSPFTPGKVEIMLPLEGTAYANASTRELVVTLNPGP